MTLGEYLTNPYGIGVGVAPTSMIKDSVLQDLNKNKVQIPYSLYSTKDRHLIIHCKLHSRTKKGISYDVVIDLDLNEEDDVSRKSINRMPFQVFSNSPSFYYTYAKVFEEKGLFCSWLKKKYERKVMRKDPEKRNPARIVGYERTVYTCMLYVSQYLSERPAVELFNRAAFTTRQDLARKIASQDEIEAAYEKAPYTDEVQKKKDEVAKRKEEARLRKEKQELEKRKSENASKTTPKTSSIKKSGSSKKSGVISRIKKLGRK